MEISNESITLYCSVCRLYFSTPEAKALHGTTKRHIRNSERGRRWIRGGSQSCKHWSTEKKQKNFDLRQILKVNAKRAKSLHESQLGVLAYVQHLSERARLLENGEIYNNNNNNNNKNKERCNNYDDKSYNKLGDSSDTSATWEVLLPRVYSILKLEANISKDQVLNVYKWGSRWWGTAHPDSDYDFLVIVKGWNQPWEHNVVQKDNIDIAIYEAAVFQALLDDHVLWAVPFKSIEECGGALVCQHIFTWPFRLIKWKHAVRHNVNKNYSLAKQFWKDGAIVKSKKRLAYVVRHLKFAFQIALHGKIVDKCMPNELVLDLLQGKFLSWKQIENWYETNTNQTFKKLKRCLNFYRHFEKAYCAKSTRTELTATVAFVKEYGIDQLEYMLSIKVFHHIQYPHLVRLSCIKGEAPRDSLIVQESEGLILDTRDLRIVAMPYMPFVHRFPFDKVRQRNVDKVKNEINRKMKKRGTFRDFEPNWNHPIHVYEKLDGDLAVLYCRDGHWSVDIDGEEFSICSDDCSDDDTSSVVLQSKGKRRRRKSILFWELWEQCGYGTIQTSSITSDTLSVGVDPTEIDPHYCYYFEMIHESCGSGIVKYESESLVLTGVRRIHLNIGNNDSSFEETKEECEIVSSNNNGSINELLLLNEVSHELFALRYHWETVREFSKVKTKEQVLELCWREQPYILEGVVVCDPSPDGFKRAVFRNPQFVLVQKLQALGRMEKYERNGEVAGDEQDEFKFMIDSELVGVDILEEDGTIDYVKQQKILLLQLILLQLRAATLDLNEHLLCEERLKKNEIEFHSKVQTKSMKEHLCDLFATMFPDYAEEYYNVYTILDTFCTNVDSRLYTYQKKTKTSKAFAAFVTKDKHKPLLFLIWKKKYKKTIHFFSDYYATKDGRNQRIAELLFEWIIEFL